MSSIDPTQLTCTTCSASTSPSPRCRPLPCSPTGCCSRDWANSLPGLRTATSWSTSTHFTPARGSSRNPTTCPASALSARFSGVPKSHLPCLQATPFGPSCRNSQPSIGWSHSPTSTNRSICRLSRCLASLHSSRLCSTSAGPLSAISWPTPASPTAAPS